jgi:predicted dehydrogenase
MTLSMEVAVIGLGSIGLRHGGNIRSLGCRVIGFDPDPKRQAMLSGDYCITVESRDEALTKADAAIIASPNACHLDDARAAVDAGCHVLIEKPLAHIEDGVEDLLNVAAAKGLTLGVAHNLRFHPIVEAAKNFIKAGELGDLQSANFVCSSYLPDWRPEQDHRQNYTADAKTGGVLFDISHEFDLAYYLLGAATTISASAENSGTLGIDAEDSADVVLEHACGARTELHLDYKSKQASRGFDITGTGGRLQADILKSSLTLFDATEAQTDEQTFDGKITDMYEFEMSDFLNAIESKSSPCSDGRQGLDVLRLVLKARRLSGLPSV